MDTAQKNELRLLLEKSILEAEQSIAADMRTLEGFESKTGDTFDRAKSAAEAELTAKLQDHKQLQLRKLRFALKQLNRNDYGECESCGSDIGFERMRALPTSTMCISCKEAEEMGTQKLNESVEITPQAMSNIFRD
jgi:DnaK suppressor protein